MGTIWKKNELTEIRNQKIIELVRKIRNTFFFYAKNVVYQVSHKNTMQDNALGLSKAPMHVKTKKTNFYPMSVSLADFKSKQWNCHTDNIDIVF